MTRVAPIIALKISPPGHASGSRCGKTDMSASSTPRIGNNLANRSIGAACSRS